VDLQPRYIFIVTPVTIKDNYTWRQITPESAIPLSRDYHSVNNFNNSMILFGGYLQEEPTNDLWAFNYGNVVTINITHVT
jgi:hypothetical protein